MVRQKRSEKLFRWLRLATACQEMPFGFLGTAFAVLLTDVPRRKYSVWGEVIEGMDLVDKIKKGREFHNGAISGAPDKILNAVSRPVWLIALG